MFSLPTPSEDFPVAKFVGRLAVAFASNFAASQAADAVAGAEDDPSTPRTLGAGAAAFGTALTINVAGGYASDLAIDTIGHKLQERKSLKQSEETTESPEEN